MILLGYIISMGDFMFKVNNDLRNANVARTIRFTESMFNQLNEIAEKNDISFNLLVLQCCKYAIENMEDDSSES